MTLNDIHSDREQLYRYEDEKVRGPPGLSSVPEVSAHDFADPGYEANSVRRISSVKREALNASQEEGEPRLRHKFSTNWDELASDTNSEPFREFESLRLEDGPLGTGSPARPSPLPKANSPAIRKVPSSSAGSTRVPSSGAQYPTALRVPSGATPTARRVSGPTRSDIFTDPPEKAPLSDDMSFGNTPSGIRQFSRGSAPNMPDEPWQHLTFRHEGEDHELKLMENETKHRSPLRQSTVPDENTPPPPSREDRSTPSSIYSSQILEHSEPQPKTREGLLGQRVHMKAINPAVQQVIAESGSQHSRDALSEAADALQRLEYEDPAGLWALMKGIAERMTGDKIMAKDMKLGIGTRRGERSNVLGDQRRIVTPQESPMPPPTSSHGQSPADFKFPAAPAPRESRLRSNSARRSHITPSRAQQDGQFRKPATPTKPTPRTPRDSPNKSRHTPSKSQVQISPSKLVLSNNNPHLKSHHRRRQSALVLGSDDARSPDQRRAPDQRPRSMLVGDLNDGIDPQRLPGYLTPGLEHVSQLANALYGRWAEGLGNRWGAP
jgi:serine/threonine-protein kinase 24/25/MST4